MNNKLPKNPRILITRTDRIGDLVVSTPVFEAIKRKYPTSHIAVCIFSEHRELVQDNPFVDEVILYEKKGRQKNWLGQWLYARQIKKKQFDLVLHLHATNRMHLMSLMAGIPRRVGYDRRAAWALTHVQPYDKKEGLMHESEYLAHFCAKAFSQLGEEAQLVDLALPRVSASKRNLLSVSNLLEHYGLKESDSFIVIHPSASDASKMWPAEKYAELIKHFPNASKFRWISVGDHKASQLTKQIAILSGVAVINLCHQLSLGMLAALFARSKLVISNDSGPAHIAAAIEAPTISIFGRWQSGLNAERWKPRGRHVATVTAEIKDIEPQDRKFSYINEITVDQVVKACKSVLK